MDVSNADRVIFPDDGITKGAVVDYYVEAAEVILPFISRRALTVERYPKGIAGKGFMQKNAPAHFGPDLITLHEVPKEGGTTVYPVVEGATTISAFANLGVITFHVPPSTIDDTSHPDWAIWDLDPPEGRADLVREAALVMREALGSFGIDTGLMTSGSNGYHLRCPLVPSADSGVVAGAARAVSALAAAAHPDLLTLAFKKVDRGDRVFVDWLRNAPYSTSVAPWSLRPRSGAPVATPITWEQIETVDPVGIRIHEAPALFDTDPWADIQPIDMTDTALAIGDALAEAGIILEPFDRFRS